MKRIWIILLAVTILLSGCNSARKFDEEWMVGKTAQEIIDRYGMFDAGKPSDAVYQNCTCSYYIKKDTKADPGEIAKDLVLRIQFDSSGKATMVYEETELRRVTLPGQYAEPIWAPTV